MPGVTQKQQPGPALMGSQMHLPDLAVTKPCDGGAARAHHCRPQCSACWHQRSTHDTLAGARHYQNSWHAHSNSNSAVPRSATCKDKSGAAAETNTRSCCSASLVSARAGGPAGGGAGAPPCRLSRRWTSSRPRSWGPSQSMPPPPHSPEHPGACFFRAGESWNGVCQVVVVMACAMIKDAIKQVSALRLAA